MVKKYIVNIANRKVSDSDIGAEYAEVGNADKNRTA